LAAHLASKNNFAGHLSVKLDKKMKIVKFLYTLQGILRFGGTPKNIPQHNFASRHTG